MMKPINPNMGFSRKAIGSSQPRGSFFSHDIGQKKKILKRSIVGVAILLVIAFGWLYSAVYTDLPDVSTIKNMIFSEATIITDRNDKELYKLFDQNRSYIAYDKISPMMINAIIATEDQRYWEHNGLDAMGIIRAGLKTSAGSLQGASTIPQQLVTNLLLYRGKTFGEKVMRKLKEFVLTTSLDSVLEDQIRTENKSLSDEQLRTKMKETILELYLNYIFLGNNAYGVEAASQTYFGKPAQELGVLESAIIASIPKGPSIYEPYRGKTRLMGDLRIADTQGNIIQASTGLQAEAYSQMASSIQATSFAIGKSSTDSLNLLESLGSFRLTYEGRNFDVSYADGRKDLALTRMFEDGYISQEQLKTALVEGLNYEFKTHIFSINAPHFVHRITELLGEQYDTGTIQKGGLIVKTSLDFETQQQIEKIFKDTESALPTYGANNKAMLYIDSSNGDVLAYVGSVDYFNEDIEGKNDIIRRNRQIGSSIKPLIYALGLQTLPITIDTPIFDIPFTIGPDQPNNYDGEFYGMLPLRQALSFSRNIPAVKMFFALGGEAVAKPWLKKMGLESLSDTVEYGYPLGLGAGEVTMLELADAYMQLSRQGERVVINPILEIKSRDGSILYQKEVEKKESVLSPGAASLIWEILSNPLNMPPSWVGMFAIRNLKLATKSGTSDVKTPKGDRPRDGWLATYTPSKVALFWVGNTDGTPMNKNSFGTTVLGANMRAFYGWLRDNNRIVNETMTPVETSALQVSKLTGLPIGSTTPTEFVVSTKTSTQPSKADMGAEAIEYDSLCNGLVSPYTPLEDIQHGYLIQAYTFMPNQMDLRDISLWRNRSTQKDTGWIQSLSASEKGRALATKYNVPHVFVTAPTAVCPERIPKEDQRITVEILQPTVSSDISRHTTVTYRVESPKNIREVIVTINEQVIGKNAYSPARKIITDMVSVDIPQSIPNGDIVIKVMAVDIGGFSHTTSETVTLITNDTQAPRVENKRIIANADGTTEVKLYIVDDASYVVSGSITKGGVLIQKITGSVVSFISKGPGDYHVTAVDYYGNKLETTIAVP